MRKNYLGALLLAGTLAFTACQNETVIYVDENGNPIENVDLKEGEGLLKINLTNTGLETRAVRPVGSSAAANTVNTVKVYVYSSAADDSNYALDTNVSLKGTQSGIEISGGIITITSYNGGAEHTNDVDVNHEVATVKLGSLKKKQYYKFVAVGYNAETAGEANPYGDATFALFSATTTTEKTGYGVEELFAGVSTTAVQATEKANFSVTPSVTMERQVAGMLGYFENVPTNIDGIVVKYVKVYANKGFKKFTYPSSVDFNGNTALAEGKVELLSFDMSAIATNWDETEPQAESYTFENWTTGKPLESSKAPIATDYTAPEGLKLVENSIFGGCYIIPYDKHYSEQTLTVELQGADNKVLKTLNVTTNNVPSDGTVYAYDIRRNNFYSIGEKYKTDSTDPEDPDNPVDLGGSTNIEVKINDAWKVLHNMGVEE